MLKPLPVNQIEERNMESVAVLKAPLARFSQKAGWAFHAGGDDFDDFDGAAFDLAGVGSVGLVNYKGQPVGTSSVLVPQNLSGEKKRKLIEAILAAGALDRTAVEWTVPTVQLGSRRAGTIGRVAKSLVAGAKSRRAAS
ncbi:hypothetical protein [Brevundimonas sp.]|jgi:hypothetical protein|uniref:hypothetical protein n=1 Tax=Brevundimonas sp. TaxID=1871086 RepID=UPI002E0EA5AB|nr:hypothetical protein [Brevundimonas sp.]